MCKIILYTFIKSTHYNIDNKLLIMTGSGLFNMEKLYLYLFKNTFNLILTL